MITLRAGLYACSPEALAEIVNRAIAKLADHVDNPAASRDRITLALELVGIELGETCHAKQAEVDLAKKLGVYQSWVTHLESGQRRIDVVELIELGRIIGFDPAEVVRKLNKR